MAQDRLSFCAEALFLGTLYFAILTQVQAQSYSFSTLAGKPGLRSADGTNASAIFGAPWGIARGPDGTLYVSDTQNATVRQLVRDGSNWVVTTIAGSPGVCGIVDGTGSAARFGDLRGVAVDAATNVYVADSYAQTIRKLVRDGTNWITSTLAGARHFSGYLDGRGAGAYFAYPQGLATDTAGDIFVADSENDTIRKITPSSGTVTTIAGYARFLVGGGGEGFADGTNSSARFHTPSGVAVDPSGNLYVADQGNHAIRKITRRGTDWITTTVAGLAGNPGTADGTNSEARFSSPSAVWVNPDGRLFVADSDNHTIRLIELFGTNAVVSTWAGLPGAPGSVDGSDSDARFNFPEAICGDAAGNLLVADTFNGAIRQVTTDSDAAVSSLVGRPKARRADGLGEDARFWQPSGMAVGPSGDIFLADCQNHAIRRLVKDGSGWTVSTVAGLLGTKGVADGTNDAARFNYPAGVAVDVSNNLYVADTQNDLVRKIVPVGSNWVVTTLAGFPSNGGLATVDGTNNSARIGAPTDLAVDCAGNIFVAQAAFNVRKITPVGTNWVVTTICAGAGSTDGTNEVAKFMGPSGIALDPAGNIFVADTPNHTIRRIARMGTNWVVTTIAGLAATSGSVDGTNSAARFSSPWALRMDCAGNIFVAEANNHTIRKITPIGTNWVVSTVGGIPGEPGLAGGLSGTAQFNSPKGVAVDAAGNLLVADSGNDIVRFGQALQARPSAIDTDKDGMPDFWELAYGFNPIDPADASVDPDGDGYANLVEFALGTDPKNFSEPQPGVSAALAQADGGNHLLITYKRRKLFPSGLEYLAEVSDDMKIWYSDPNHAQVVDVKPLDTEFDSVTVRDLTTALPNAPRFARLRIAVSGD